MRVESYGIDELIVALESTEELLGDRVEQATKKSIGNIKDDATRLLRQARSIPTSIPHLPRSFTSDVSKGQDRVEAEAGASWEMLQGRLDVFLEYGSPTSNPHPHWRPAALREEPRWEKALEDACVGDLE